MPGERIGPIPIGAAAEPLRETIGQTHVHRVISDTEKGMGLCPWDLDFRRPICGGFDPYKTCKWRIAGGIPLTSTVETFEKLNGRPFIFNFDGPISWEGDRIGRFTRMRFVVVCHGDQPQRLAGEVRLRSDDPDIRKLKCNVTAIDF